MKIIFSDRTLFYSIAGLYFKQIGVKPRCAELGVFRGDNAKLIFDALSPETLLLIDQWDTAGFDDYRSINQDRDWVDDVSSLTPYYGGSVSDQNTFDHMLNEVRQKFSGFGNIRILQSSTTMAFNKLKTAAELVDFVYVDANHQYEKVLDDLMNYSSILSNYGLIQLNDCCHSSLGVKQNLGVLEATNKFCKITGFQPVMVTNSDWTDVVLSGPKNAFINYIDMIILSNGIRFVEIPNELLGSLKVVYGKNGNLSFCG
jgi:hypothetical protein